MQPDASSPSVAQQQFEAAVVLHSMGRHGEALSCLQRSLALDPDSLETHVLLGNVLAALGRHDEAVAAFEKALELRPDVASTLNNLGNSLGALGRHEQALACFERALAVQPTFVLAHYNFGMALAALSRHEEAVAHFRIVASEWPGHPGALYNLGNSLSAAFRAAEALEVFEQLLAIDSRVMPAHLGAGNALQALGRFTEARGAYERALALAPDVPTLHRAVAEIKQFREGDPQLKAMEALARDMARFPEQERISLHFALAKAYDDLGQHMSAFEHLRSGNALKRRTIVYDEAAQLGALHDIESAFTADLMQARRGQGDPSELPVFILGMPRSGTTLIEQVLASHPRAFGAGELRHLLDLVEEGHAGARFPFDFASLSDEGLFRLGSLYAARLKSHAPQADRIADKLPANFRYVGLIHLALPKARIIHVSRDPVDTCFSCYSKLFVNGLEFTCDLGELGRYYRAYEILMAHWRRILPEGAMIEVQYEDLVADFETQARRIVEYCGLEWDERCLRFHEAERPIYTVSVQQVRRPLFRSSVGKWRPYKKHLSVLLETLGIDPT
ncbi:MAG: sulfotransferase [Alphaproteobacteria bacterium]|nr:sulfotransferase [Alphaproteobacteria bacterium]